jgi:hypothetical protein
MAGLSVPFVMGRHVVGHNGWIIIPLENMAGHSRSARGKKGEVIGFKSLGAWEIELMATNEFRSH